MVALATGRTVDGFIDRPDRFAEFRLVGRLGYGVSASACRPRFEMPMFSAAASTGTLLLLNEQIGKCPKLLLEKATICVREIDNSNFEKHQDELLALCGLSLRSR